jgi:hypothetical protein
MRCHWKRLRRNRDILVSLCEPFNTPAKRLVLPESLDSTATLA